MPKTLRALALPLLAVGSLAAACQDKRVFPLGDQVVTRLQASALVADTIYQYHPTGGEGEAAGLEFTVYLTARSLNFEEVEPLVADAADEMWKSTADVDGFGLRFVLRPTASAPLEPEGPDPASIDVAMSLRQKAVSVKTSAARSVGAPTPTPVVLPEPEAFVGDLYDKLLTRYGAHKT